MHGMMTIETFASQSALADAAAGILAAALAASDARSFVATGGTTPGPTYDRLSLHDLGWDRITVTLSDERWVDPTAPESNEGLVRRRLLTHHAARAAFLPLKGRSASPQADAAAAQAGLRSLAPFAAVLLGMGPDGHIASLFPGAPGLAQALDPDGPSWCVGVGMAGLHPKVPRISLTARALLSSAIVVLLITGAEKRRVLDHVASDPAFSPPVATMLRQTRIPVRVLWAG